MPEEAHLRGLAKVTISRGVGLIPGQDLVVLADVNALALTRLIIEEAYKAGARAVTPLMGDDQASLLRHQFGSDESIAFTPSWLHKGIESAIADGSTAYLRIWSADPSLLKHIDPTKVAASSKSYATVAKGVGEYITSYTTNWCIVPAASAGWAKHVFPGLPESEAIEKLWEAIFKCTRADQPDPVVAWDAHCERVANSMKRMNSARFSALHFKGPGTDLTVGLADGHLWEGVEIIAKNGAHCSPNIPTEEIFTMPHCSRVNGYVSSTMPLSLRGQIVDGITVTFKDGAVVEASAKQGYDALRKLLDTDEGSVRLGEVALVPVSSPIFQTGLIFFNTLFDENAACHIALGQCYASTMEGYESLSKEERLKRGANESLIHIDWMIGSPEVDVDGIGGDGSITPLMRGCQWV